MDASINEGSSRVLSIDANMDIRVIRNGKTGTYIFSAIWKMLNVLRLESIAAESEHKKYFTFSM